MNPKTQQGPSSSETELRLVSSSSRSPVEPAPVAPRSGDSLRRKGVPVYPAALSMLFSVLGCNRQHPTIALIPRTTATMAWEAAHAGAEFASGKSGVQLYWNAPAREDDVQLQIDLIDKAIDKRYSGLVIAPDEPRALMAPVQRALSAGVPVVVINSPLPLPPQPHLSYVLNDDDAVGRLAAERFNLVLQGHGHVAVVGIDPQSTSSMAVLRSFVSYLESHFPKITVVDQRSASSNDMDAEFVANELLLHHPELDAVFSLAASDTAGAFLALQDSSRASKVKVIGVQQSVQLNSAIRLHQIDSVIAIDTYHMGYKAVEILLSHSSKPQIIRLSPLLLTAENLDSPEAKTFTTNDWRPDLQ